MSTYTLPWQLLNIRFYFCFYLLNYSDYNKKFNIFLSKLLLSVNEIHAFSGL